MYKIVIDTNILVSAHLKNQGFPRWVLKSIFRREVELYVSPSILAEYEKVLRYPKLKFASEEVRVILATLRRYARVIRPRMIQEDLVRDQDDLKFLECALAARAHFVVTGDKRAFKVGEYRGIRIVTAREFIGELSLGLEMQ